MFTPTHPRDWVPSFRWETMQDETGTSQDPLAPTVAVIGRPAVVSFVQDIDDAPWWRSWPTHPGNDLRSIDVLDRIVREGRRLPASIEVTRRAAREQRLRFLGSIGH